ncbi:uncharacterized protein LOC111397848 [Olea europaea var. sylvestris]|uniref:uncharacterized protein LOC111397848 n=1 Tax=Olea europaea var. sylvestris TaxID=158386 RepID=UPI000C1D2F65|nr:uncharacterized protein LOC111397848 [Olea europaea var. sylvestris]
MKEFDLDPTKIAVSLKYTLNEDLPPIKIRNESNVLSYIMLKDMERKPTKYPLIIDVAEVEVDKLSITLPVNPHAVGELCTLQDIASDICETTIENIGHIDDNEITVVYVADGRDVEEEKVFYDKDILKLSLSLFAIQNMFEFMVERSDKKEYIVSHTCASNVVLGSHRQLSATVLSSNIKYKYTSSRTIYTLKDICSDMLHTYGVYLNYLKAWRSREQTLKMIRGDPTDLFGNIPRFFYMVQQKNPETVTNLEVDSHNRFKYCFMTLGASIRDWKHCRPVIVVDGTYLNGHYGDRHNNIKNAIEHVYLGTYHGICSYHLLQNLKSHFGKSGQNITQAFNSAVRVYTLEEFEYHMRQLDTMNQKISAYLVKVGPEKWSRIHMLENRYSTMTLNIVELVNAVTKAAKNYPIVFPSNQSVFSVSSDKTTFVVDIKKQTCTCGMLQVDLLPCPQALAVIANTKRDPYTFYSYYYTRDAYLNAYEDSIYPVGNPCQWTLSKEVQHEIVLASNQKWSCGRSTEKRKRSSREGKPTVKCGRCGGHGHNRRRCSSLVPLS